MRRLLQLLAFVPFSVFGATLPNSWTDVELVGMTAVGEIYTAFLTGKESGRYPRLQQMRAGQSDRGVEVVAVNPHEGSVSLRQDGKLSVLRLGSSLLRPQTKLGAEGVAIRFERVDKDTVLELLAEFSNRTVLRDPRLPYPDFAIETGAVSKADAIRVIGDALIEKGVKLVPEGEKFLLAVPAASQVEPLPPLSNGAPLAISTAAASEADAPIYQKDGLRLQNLDVYDLLDKIYAETTGRTLLLAPALPAAKITLRAVTPLTKGEFTHMLECVLALNGIKLVPEGDKFMLVVPTSFPLDRLPPLTRPAANPQGDPIYQKDGLRLQGLDVREFIAKIYAPAAGREVRVGNFPMAKISFTNKTPLTRAEFLYACERLLQLNAIALKPVDDNAWEAAREPISFRAAPSPSSPNANSNHP